MKLRFFRAFLSLILCAAALPLVSCSPSDGWGTKSDLVRETRIDLLGTVISLSLPDNTESGIFDGAFSIVEDIDERMSVTGEKSEILAINSKRESGVATVSDDTYDLIRQAILYSELSGGAFDISIGAIMELWKSDGVFGVLPADVEIKSALPLVGYGDIVLENGGVMLRSAGMKLDLGGIAKGYACDRVVEYLKTKGIESALLDFGGNIYAHGSKRDGGAWKIGIRSPVPGDVEVACTLEVRDLSVVTSGGYESYFEEGGETYHHILDPETGYPARSGLLSVTVIDRSSTRADAMSTASFVLGLQKGYELIESLDGCEAIFITDDFRVHPTSGLDGVVILDPRYTLVEQGAE